MPWVAFALGLLLASTCRAEIAQHPYLSGLLEVPKVFGKPDPKGPPGAKTYASGKVAVYPVAQKKKWPPPKSVEAPGDLLSEELAALQPAAAVYARKKGWYEVALKDGRGWIMAQEAGSFHPLEDLVTGGLAYLTPEWDGRLWPQAERKGESYTLANDDTDYGAQVIASKKTTSGLWLQVRVLSSDGCDEEAKPLAVGWVPAHAPKGAVNVWFYPRGCHAD